MNKIRKVTWNEIKNKVKLVNPTLYPLLDEILSNQDIPFFLGFYNFGVHFGIKNHAYLPDKNGVMHKINSKYLDEELVKHLGYGKNSLPLGMILDKYCEWHYIDDNGRIYPDCVQGKGAIFNMQIIFDEAETMDK